MPEGMDDLDEWDDLDESLRDGERKILVGGDIELMGW